MRPPTLTLPPRSIDRGPFQAPLYVGLLPSSSFTIPQRKPYHACRGPRTSALAASALGKPQDSHSASHSLAPGGYTGTAHSSHGPPLEASHGTCPGAEAAGAPLSATRVPSPPAGQAQLGPAVDPAGPPQTVLGNTHPWGAAPAGSQRCALGGVSHARRKGDRRSAGDDWSRVLTDWVLDRPGGNGSCQMGPCGGRGCGRGARFCWWMALPCGNNAKSL